MWPSSIILHRHIHFRTTNQRLLFLSSWYYIVLLSPFAIYPYESIVQPELTNPVPLADRHFGSRSCEEHPLQYLLRASDPTGGQQPWGLPSEPSTLDHRSPIYCYHHQQDRHTAHHPKHHYEQHQQEPHYETLEPLEGPPRPLFSSLAAVLNMGPPVASPCHVAYCGIQSPTDSDSSFVDPSQVRMSPSSPENDLTDSLPNLDRRSGCGPSSLPASLTYWRDIGGPFVTIKVRVR